MNVNIEDQEVNKMELVTLLTKNRDDHEKTYQAANSGYRDKTVFELRKRAQQIDTGGKVNLNFSLCRPERHTSEYDTVIGLLNLSTAITVKLGLQDYRKLVQDEWDWSSGFRHTASGCMS